MNANRGDREREDEKARILVVDDDEMIRSLIAQRLERDGYATAAAGDGKAALAMIAGDAWDLVLLDVAMPDLDGLAVLRALRERFAAVELPVIMVTGRSETEQVIDALELGANDYIPKPIDFPVALARIATHVSLKRMHHAQSRLEAQASAGEAETRLRDAIESIPDGFSLYDADGRLVICNSHNRAFFAEIGEMLVPGTRFEDIVRAGVARGIYRDTGADHEQWVEQRLKNRTQDAPFVERLTMKDGRCLAITGRRTADGGFVSIQTDVTAEMTARREAQLAHLRLVDAVENLPHSFALFDADDRLVLWNHHLQEFAPELSPLLVKGTRYQDLVVATVKSGRLAATAGDPEAWSRAWMDRHRSAAPRYEVEYKNGRAFVIEEGRTQEGGSVVIGIEVTAEREVERALRESEEQYRSLVQVSPDGLLVNSATRKGVVFANPSLARLLGRDSAAELMGRRVRELVHPDDIPVLRKQRGWVVANGRVTPYEEIRLRRADGKTVHCESALAPFSWRGDAAFLRVVRDITERKEAERKLMQSARLASLGEMAAGMAHELNQPLNVIRMAADSSVILMEEGRLDPQRLREQLLLIAEQTQVASEIIDHMRIFGRGDTAEPVLFNTGEVVRRALDLVDDELRLADIELVTALPKACSPVVGHPVQLEQVVVNLVNNARDSILENANRVAPGSQDRRGRIEIHLFDDAENGWVRLLVRDNGGGIRDDIIDRVFDPFFTTKDAARGTGLGLSISYGIVRDMGGRITVANVPDGACFEVELPVCPVQ